MLRETEEELVRSAQLGNMAAFERLLQNFAGPMLAVAAGFAGNPHDADDIYQDAMLAAWRALPNFKLESRFSTWLHRVVVNTALSNHCKLKRTWQKLNAVQAEHRQQEKYMDHRGPESSLLDRELSSAINQALMQLTDRERMAFVLCHQQGFKLREAAQMMECSDDSIKVTLFRGRKKMQQQLKAYH